MKKLIILLLFLALLVFTPKSHASNSIYNKDYIECSSISNNNTKTLSDAMFFGIVIGCMQQKGYPMQPI